MHVPVLLQEVINYLQPQPNENFIDATIGEGGHTKAILEHNQPQGLVLGLERDQDLYAKLAPLKKQFSDRLILVNDSYAYLEEIVKQNNFFPIAGVLFDLGMCSWHIDESGRGFTYKKDEPLDMRFDQGEGLTAGDILNNWSVNDLERILRDYGEERYAFRIAQAIKEYRKKNRFVSTSQLVDLLKKTLPRNYDNHRLPFPARTFQALRIAVNDELRNLQKGLEQALKVAAPNARIVVISFHSLEDRIVKNFFKDAQKQNKVKILTKKPERPTPEEIKRNPRSASAKLRAVIKN